MIRYYLRTLLILLAILPLLFGWGWLAWKEHVAEVNRRAEQARLQADEEAKLKAQRAQRVKLLRVLEDYSRQVAGSGFSQTATPPNNEGDD